MIQQSRLVALADDQLSSDGLVEHERIGSECKQREEVSIEIVLTRLDFVVPE